MQNFTATFEDRFDFNDRFVKLSFELKEPFRMDFYAGQYIKIKISENLEREYFIFSSPNIDHGIEILVDKNVEGEGANYLTNLKPGDLIEMTAPYGDFILDKDLQSELILIGTNSGLAPLNSMVLDLLQAEQSKRKITLYWGLDKLDDFFLFDEMSQLTKNFPNFNFHPVIAKALPEWTLCRGSVFDCLNVHQINADAQFYICANKEISDKIKNLCLENGVGEDQLHITSFIR